MASNTLKRNKEIIHRHNNGETFVKLAEEYGIAAGNMSLIYYGYEYLVDRPCYDLVAAMDLSDQIASKLVNALCRYEGVKGVDVDAEYIKTMDRKDLLIQRGVGNAVMDAFDQLQEAVRNG